MFCCKNKLGWRSRGGMFAEFTGPSFQGPVFEIIEPEYPGKDGRLAVDLAFFIKPGGDFGLWSKHIVTAQLVAQLPYIHTGLNLGFGVNNCNNNEFGLSFDANFGLSLSAELIINEIRLLGIKIYNGGSFEPPEPLFDLSLFDINFDFGCIGFDDINPTQLFGNSIERIGLNDLPWVMFKTTNENEQLTWSEANAYCEFTIGTNLATIQTYDQFLSFEELVAVSSDSSVNGKVWIGLNDRNQDGIWAWSDINQTINFDYRGINQNNENCFVRDIQGNPLKVIDDSK